MTTNLLLLVLSLATLVLGWCWGHSEGRHPPAPVHTRRRTPDRW